MSGRLRQQRDATPLAPAVRVRQPDEIETRVQRAATILRAFPDAPPDIICVDPLRNLFDGARNGFLSQCGPEAVAGNGATFLPKIGVIIAELHGDYTLERFNEDLEQANLKAHVSEFARDPQIVIASRV